MPLHPWIEARVSHLHAMAEVGGFDSAAGQEHWSAFSRAPEYRAPDVSVENVELPRADAADGRLSVRVYSPAAPPGFSSLESRSGAGLVWSHGGGFTGGDIDMFEADGVARELVARAGGVVVSVDYRLADSLTHYPAPTDDVRLAWEWTLASSDRLGIDPRRLAVGGASAGAALTSAVVVALRDDGAALPSRVLLAYPVVHPTLPAFSHELAEKLRDVPAILDYSPGPDRARNPMLEALLGGPAWWTTSHVMAGLADLEGFPPTVILNSEYDALRASGQRFAAQLAEAGVDVAVRNEPGVLHGHLNLPPVLTPVNDSLAWLAGALLA